METRPLNYADDAATSASSALTGARVAFPGPTILVSFTTATPSMLTSTRLYLYEDALRVLLGYYIVTLFTVSLAAPRSYCSPAVCYEGGRAGPCRNSNK